MYTFFTIFKTKLSIEYPFLLLQVSFLFASLLQYPSRWHKSQIEVLEQETRVTYFILDNWFATKNIGKSSHGPGGRALLGEGQSFCYFI